MTQTAIEWLVNKITTEHDKSFSEFYGAEIQQAKEMEKKQIIDANRDGVDMYIMNRCSKSNKFISGEDYYAEKYKQ